ncbi:hypothetical protein A9P82_12500 [Arachidicoccus ginsenosidimutans]|uniref:DUF4252 domain-containing protein n=1 Tax=Arachidicoccus sp. BS20 TaxID=1850526 RepID=UPI0007F0E7F4|nr:DUF4252 domain-containing protein [Arachidicoccus sp. BS20]ANI90029.1 hypothetical protein A9P82_12500 [Arachidicoccus sp. BS20]
MKKNLLLIALFISVSANVFAQKSLDRFVHKYRSTANADYVHVGSFLMALAHPFIPADDDGTRLLKKIHSVEVLDFNINSQQPNVHHDMKLLQSDLIKDGYDELMFVKSEGDRVHILGKIQGDKIVKDCVLLVDSDNEISVVHVTGKINLDEIGNLSGKFGNAKFSVAKN